MHEVGNRVIVITEKAVPHEAIILARAEGDGGGHAHTGWHSAAWDPDNPVCGTGPATSFSPRQRKPRKNRVRLPTF